MGKMIKGGLKLLEQTVNAVIQTRTGGRQINLGF